MPGRKKIEITVSDMDMEIIFQALGLLVNQRADRNGRTKPVQIVIDKLYRAMGVRL